MSGTISRRNMLMGTTAASLLGGVASPAPGFAQGAGDPVRKIVLISDTQGAVPARLLLAGAPCYTWDRDKFGTWVETAYKKAYPYG